MSAIVLCRKQRIIKSQLDNVLHRNRIQSVRHYDAAGAADEEDGEYIPMKRWEQGRSSQAT